MRASVVTALGQPFTVQDLQIDEPRGREVLVDIRASGLCHSDLHQTQNDFGMPWPAVLGHEVAGVVAAVGPEVTTVKPGDHVAASLISFCGACVKCLSGRTFECRNPEYTARGPELPPRLRTQDGEAVTQAFGLGGFAAQSLIHENQVITITDQIPFAAASLIGCAVITGAGAVINTAAVRVGDTVAVIGTGGVGLNAISGARIAGAARIIAVDIDGAKLDMARRFGATHTVNARQEDAVEAVRRLTDGGADHTFEVIGLELTQAQAYDMTAPGGRAYVIGIAQPGVTLSIDSSMDILTFHKGVQGVLMGSTNIKRDIPLYAELYVQGRLNLDDLVSREITLDEIDEAYAALAEGGIIRSVITSF